MGPLPPAFDGRKLIIVAVKYFFKWVEAKALAYISDKAVLLAKIGQYTCKVKIYNELRLEAADSMAHTRDSIEKYFNRKAKARQIAVEG
ncbi:hypothetical protein CRG98_006731 [Punica granatum]|uniref:Uncharacterized protein n=1 Tax=Punica granatum TaxID=22663 RepID=A0A2I0KWY3_PUNGR|nr:hypothetical protein CRG98_006731 [Punica granatum]